MFLSKWLYIYIIIVFLHLVQSTIWHNDKNKLDDNNPINVFFNKLSEELVKKGITTREYQYNQIPTFKQICEGFNQEILKSIDLYVVSMIRLYELSSPCWINTGPRRGHVSVQFYIDEGKQNEANAFIEGAATLFILPFKLESNESIQETIENTATVIQLAVHGFPDLDFYETKILTNYKVPIPYQVIRTDKRKPFDYKFWITFALSLILFGAILAKQILFKGVKQGKRISDAQDAREKLNSEDGEADLDSPMLFGQGEHGSARVYSSRTSLIIK